MRRAFNPYTEATAVIVAEDKVAQTAGFGGEFTKVWAVWWIDAFFLNRHNESICSWQADVMIGSIFCKCHVYRANWIPRNASGKTHTAVMDRVIEIARFAFNTCSAGSIPFADTGVCI